MLDEIESEKRLLSSDEEEAAAFEGRHQSLKNHFHLNYFNITFIIINLLFLLVNIFIPVLRWSSVCAERDLIPSPARGAVNYHTVFANVTLGEHNEFMGDPRPEQSQAWIQAYGNWIHVKVQKEDLDRIGKTSIPLADGSGYLASLDAFHQLHCVNLIRQSLHPEYYHSQESEHFAKEHVDHCLDSLRRAIMCQGDISLLTYSWEPGLVNPFPDFKQTRECRDWDSIMEWTKEHHIDIRDDILEGRPKPSKDDGH